jgi:membrane protein
MIRFVKQTLAPLGQRTWGKFQADDGMSMAASLAYYALFSLFPLLLVTLSTLGFAAGPNSNVRVDILRLAAESLPANAFEVVEGVLTSLTENRGPLGLIGFATLLLGASGFFGALVACFDKIWAVNPASGAPAGFRGKALTALRAKASAFALVLGCVLLVLVSMIADLIIGGMLAAADNFAGDLAFIPLDTVLLAKAVQLGVSFVGLTVVLALLYRALPSTSVAWNDVWPAAVLAALLFMLLQRLVVGGVINLGGSYQGYGVIGGVMLLMFWLYLTLQVLLLGAELSYAFAELHGSRRKPAGQPKQQAIPAETVAGATAADDARARMPKASSQSERTARAAGVGVLVGAVGTALLSLAALVLGMLRAIRVLRRQ